jgi:phosphoglycerate kinase
VTLRSLDDLGDVAGVRVVVRSDLNVPLQHGRVADDTRIVATAPTLRELRERGATLVVASHLGRPKGAVRDDLRMEPVGERLAEVLGEPVTTLSEPAPASLPDAPVIVLENLRFDPGEEANTVAFAGELAELADAYVNDAFGAAHRAHASVVALPELMLASGRPAVAGRLMTREVDVLSRLRRAPDRPYVAVLGGAKVSDKLGVIGALVEHVDALVLGGAMAFTAIAAHGGRVGRSLVEPDRFDDVRAAESRAHERGVSWRVPVDVVAAPEIADDAPTRIVPADEIDDDLMGLDIGPETLAEFAATITGTGTILWNGPMGVFESKPFSLGTLGIAQAIAASDAYSVVGGGDSLLAVKQAGLQDAFDHLSTGGGASLEFLEGRELPGITILEGPA